MSKLIGQKAVIPAENQTGKLLSVESPLFRREVRTPRRILEMNNRLEWRADVAISVLIHLQAKINVVVSDLETDFVEPAHLTEDGGAYGQAGGCNRKVAAHARELSVVAKVACIQEPKGMHGERPLMQHHTRMLNMPVRIEELSTDTADVRTDRV